MTSLNLNKKQIRWMLIAAAVVIVALLLFFGFRRRSGYLYDPVTNMAGVSGSQDGADTTLQTSLNTCETNFDLANNWIINAVATGGITASVGDTLRTANLATLGTCSTTAVTMYMNSKCPIANGFTGNTKPSATASITQSQIDAAWSNLQADYAAITGAYIPLVNNNSGTTLDQIKAARKADYTGAGRRFISTLCPGYYDSSNINVINDQYKSFRIGSSSYGFDSTRITLSNVQSWASNAAATIAGTSPLVANGTNYTNNISVQNQTVIGTGSASIPAWTVAASAGPGTVGTNVWVSHSANNTLTLGRISNLPLS